MSGEPPDSDAAEAKRAPDTAASPIVHIGSAWPKDQIRPEQKSLRTALDSR